MDTSYRVKLHPDARSELADLDKGLQQHKFGNLMLQSGGPSHSATFFNKVIETKRLYAAAAPGT
jgi:hypothetical protein